MLSDLERKEIEGRIAFLARGIGASRACGNHRNAELLVERRQALQNRLAADDRERLRCQRRSLQVLRDLTDRAAQRGDRKVVMGLLRERASRAAVEAKLAAKVEPTRTTTPAVVAPSSPSPGNTDAPAAAGGSFIDPRTGERVICRTLDELRARVFATLGALQPPALAGFSSVFGGFRSPGILA